MSRALPDHHHWLHPSPQRQQQQISPSPGLQGPDFNNQPKSTSPSSPQSPLDFTDRIPFNELKLSTRTLGSGSFGTVFKGLWRGRHVAVKQFKTREEIDSFLVEVKQLSCVKHTNIVTLYGASTLSDSAYLIMEYAEGGSLNHLLHECKQQVYDLRHACSWAMQAARGVAYLHGIRPKPIMHRDLKPANLLLFSRGKILKICDFGTACAVKTQMTNNTGSASYMAPEVFATSSYLESGDVFSWSIIFWEILVRIQPYSQQYSNPYQILWRVNQGTRPTEIEACPEPLWTLITRSWNKDPTRRPMMQKVAEEMEFIFSLTEQEVDKSNRSPSAPTTATSTKPTMPTTSTNSPQNPSRPMLPMFSQQASVEDRKESPFVGLRSSHYHKYHHHHRQQHSQMRPLQEQHYQYLQRQQYLGQEQSNRSQIQANNHMRALTHHIEVLQNRSKQLESELDCDKRNSANESFKEFEELKNVIKRLKEQVQLGGSCRGSMSPQHPKQDDHHNRRKSSPHNQPHHHQQQQHRQHHKESEYTEVKNTPFHL